VDSPNLKTLGINGVQMALWDWPGEDPPILFAHATGFHGRCWDEIVRLFPGRHSIAVEFRGHGRSDKPAPPYHWDAFGRDLAAVATQLQLSDAVGVGHSMGGHSIVAAAFLCPQAFSSLLLIDPTIYPREYYGRPGVHADFIRRRRNRWKSPEEMFERFNSRKPFATWQPAVLRDYCRFGLLPGDGGLVLACPPEVEASIYEHSNASEADVYPGMAAIDQPVTIMRAAVEWQPGTLNLGASPTAPDLASKFARGQDILLRDQDHYIPMESPALVAEVIARLISSRTVPRGECAHP
jgi:lipase